MIPPNTNFEKLNPKIDAELLRIKVIHIKFNKYPLQSSIIDMSIVSPRSNTMAGKWAASCLS